MRTVHRPTRALVPLALGLALLAGACGDGSDDQAEESSSTTTSSSTSTSTTVAPDDSGAEETTSAGGCDAALEDLRVAWEDGGETDPVNAATVESLTRCSPEEWAEGAQEVDDLLGANGGYVGDRENLCLFAADVLTDQGDDPAVLTAC